MNCRERSEVWKTANLANSANESRGISLPFALFVRFAVALPDVAKRSRGSISGVVPPNLVISRVVTLPALSCNLPNLSEFYDPAVVLDLSGMKLPNQRCPFRRDPDSGHWALRIDPHSEPTGPGSETLRKYCRTGKTLAGIQVLCPLSNENFCEDEGEGTRLFVLFQVFTGIEPVPRNRGLPNQIHPFWRDSSSRPGQKNKKG